MSAFFQSDTNKWLLERSYLINRVKLNMPVEAHTHDFIELVYTVRGTAIHTVDGREFSVRRGDLLFLNYHCTHAIMPLEAPEYFDIMLKPEFVDERLKGTENAFLLLELNDFKEFAGKVRKENCMLHFSAEERTQIEDLIALTQKEQEAERSGSTSMCRSALHLLLNMIFRKMTHTANELPRAVDNTLLHYIRAHCHKRLTLPELADLCFYTPEHFSRRFKAFAGMTLTQYIRQCRVERAKQLLEETNTPIDIILSDCGFTNRTAFFRSFSEAVGCTPLQYRKNQN